MGTDDGPLERLRATPVPAEAVGISWLGQAGFALRAGGSIALIDPFLRSYRGRRYESGLDASRAEGVDVVLITHEHRDHLDTESVPAIAAASPAAVFVVPTPIVGMVTDLGIGAERVLGLQPGDTAEIVGLTVRAVPAMHGATMEDAYGFGESISSGLVRFLGYVLDAGPVRLYHAGDTIPFEGLETMLGKLAIDLAMLPINGRDPAREARGIVGNLTEREAAWLASSIGAEAVIPMHHDLFERNRGYPAHLVDALGTEHPDVAAILPVRERPFVWATARRR